MSSHPPLISVVMTVYNAARFVGEAIESILNQTFGNLELIVVDDGSKDDSLAVLRRYAKAHARVKVLTRPNGGCWIASNDGLAASRGKLIARMDADDVSMPDRLEKQVAFLDANPQVVCVGSHVLLIDADGAPLRVMPDPSRLTHKDIDKGHLTGGGQVMYHPSVLIRREALEKIGLYREWPAALDLDLFLRLAEVGELANLPDVLLKYRQHMGSIGHAKMKLQLETCREMVRQAYVRRGQMLASNIGFDKIKQMTETEQHRKWAWWALKGGHVPSARKHARKALRKSLFSTASWRVMLCALRKR
jgi:glycosyltransferase involved in cell wall biosynthesis